MDIEYSRQAFKFIKKLQSIDRKRLKSKIEEIDRYFLNTINTSLDIKKISPKYKNRFRLRSGQMRIIFSIQNKIIIHKIEFRGQIYKT